ncbi:MAG: hypothetical protein ABIO70_05270 [Pseudomonadota bacterium]
MLSMLPLLLTLLLTWSTGRAGAATYGEGVWPELPALPATEMGADDAALVVGVGRYDHYPDLRGAVVSARQWVDWLAGTQGVPAERLTLLVDEQATCARVREAAFEVARSVPEGGTVWVVFIGRGALRMDAGGALLLGANADPGATEARGLGLGLSGLLDALGQGSQKRALLVLDTAFVPGESFQAGGGALPPVLEPGESFQSRGNATALLASNTVRPLPSLPELRQPPFGYLVLGALRGWADADHNDHVTVPEVMDYVRSVLGVLDPGAAALPAAWGPTEGFAISQAKEFPPDLAELLGRASDRRLQGRIQELSESERMLRAEASAVWQAVMAAYGEGGEDALASVRDFIARWRIARVQVDQMQRWVRVSEVDEAQALLAVSTVRPVGEIAARTMAEERYRQLAEEVRQFTRRGAWKGVEASYREMLALREQGVVISAQDHQSGAEAARQLGDPTAVRERLVAALDAGPNDQVVGWLNDLEQSYHRVRLVNARREPASLDPVILPFAPDKRAAVVAVQERIEDTGSYEGLLPAGVYRFGGELLVVTPGDPPVDLVIERGHRGQR